MHCSSTATVILWINCNCNCRPFLGTLIIPHASRHETKRFLENNCTTVGSLSCFSFAVNNCHVKATENPQPQRVLLCWSCSHRVGLTNTSMLVKMCTQNMAPGALEIQKLSFMVSWFLRPSRPKLPVMLSQSSLSLSSCREHGHCQREVSKQGQEEVTYHCTASQHTY